MGAGPENSATPAAFRLALESLRGVCPRPEVVLEEVSAPQRLAPHAVALSADVAPGGSELATGRLVLLHDPAGQATWEGIFRLVTYVRAELEPELITDPLLPSVGWTWLLEALEARGARHLAPSGTVTRVVSESFGALRDRPASAEVEIRASWTPLEPDMGPHLAAWCELLCTLAGLPPRPPPPPGVASLVTRQAVPEA